MILWIYESLLIRHVVLLEVTFPSSPKNGTALLLPVAASTAAPKMPPRKEQMGTDKPKVKGANRRPDSISTNKLKVKNRQNSRQGKKKYEEMIGNVDIDLSTLNCHTYSAGFVSVSFSSQNHALWLRGPYLQWVPKRHRTTIPGKRHRLRSMDLKWLNQQWLTVSLPTHISDRKKLKINFLLKKLC